MDEEELEEFIIPEEAYAKLADPEIVRRYVEEGKTFQEIIGYSQEAMDEFYQKARRLYMRGRYEESGNAFLFLTTLNPYVCGYWVGMGMSEQMSENYHAALSAYGMAALCESLDPHAHLYSAICYYFLNDRENARHSLERSRELLEDREDLGELRSSMEALESRIGRR